MLTIDRYVKAQSLKEAYELCQKRNNVVLGGMLWLKMQDRKVGAAIDLCGLGLDQITEREDAFEIGAMVSLRELEKHPGLNELTGGAISNSVEHIVGVQFRNCAHCGRKRLWTLRLFRCPDHSDGPGGPRGAVSRRSDAAG